MLQNWFIMLPEICMLGFFAVAFPVEWWRSSKTSKTFFTLAQTFLLAALILMVVFYNKSAFPDLWQNTPFSTMFKFFACLLAWAWFYLSSKWFLNKNRPSFGFYGVCFALLFCFGLLASASSLLTLGVVVPLICLFYRSLIRQHWDVDKVAPVAARYGWSALFFCLLLWGGIAVLYYRSGAFDYAAVQKFYAVAASRQWFELVAVAAVLVCLMFLMALVPFHGWFVAFAAEGVLPVCGFITLVPPLIYLCTLINLLQKCFAPFIPFLAPLLGVFASVSLLIGALSGIRENNIRRLFAFLSIYATGFVLAGLVKFSDGAVIAAFACTVITLLSLAGVYTVFLGMKSRGDYLSEINEIKGFSFSRPYMSAALLIFMFSLIGLAPTLGFFGSLSVISSLVANNMWGLTALLLFCMLFVADACLQVIRAIYFSEPAHKYDRADKAIYICLFLNVVLILISLINPVWLIHDALVIVGGVS